MINSFILSQLITTLIACFGISLFGFFAFYQHFITDDFQKSNLTIKFLAIQTYFNFVYIAFVVFVEKMNALKMETMKIARNAIGKQDSSGLRDELQNFAQFLEVNSVKLNFGIITYGYNIIQSFISTFGTYLFIVVQFDFNSRTINK